MVYRVLKRDLNFHLPCLFLISYFNRKYFKCKAKLNLRNVPRKINICQILSHLHHKSVILNLVIFMSFATISKRCDLLTKVFVVTAAALRKDFQ